MKTLTVNKTISFYNFYITFKFSVKNTAAKRTLLFGGPEYHQEIVRVIRYEIGFFKFWKFKAYKNIVLK